MKNQLNAVALALDTVISVSIKFPTTDKQYTYLSTFDVSKGDTVVVDTQWGLKLVEVTAVRPGLPTELLESAYEYKFLVTKVDLDYYANQQAAIAELREVIAEAEAAKKVEAARVKRVKRALAASAKKAEAKRALARRERIRQEALAKAKTDLGLDTNAALSGAVKLLRASINNTKTRLTPEEYAAFEAREQRRNSVESKVAQLVAIIRL